LALQHTATSFRLLYYRSTLLRSYCYFLARLTAAAAAAAAVVLVSSWHFIQYSNSFVMPSFAVHAIMIAGAGDCCYSSTVVDSDDDDDDDN